MIEMALYLSLVVFSVVVAVKLAGRLGYDGTAGLLMLLPLVGYVVLAIWAFTESPNERKIRALRRRVSELESGTEGSPVACLEATTGAPAQGGGGDGSELGPVGVPDLKLKLAPGSEAYPFR